MKYGIIKSKAYVEACDMILNVSRSNWAETEMGNYYIYVEKLTRSAFPNSKAICRKAKIKTIINSI